MAKLILKTGERCGMEFEVKPDLVMGRRLELPLHVNDTKASREHAKIVLEGGRFVLVDLNSTNGTFVNGNRVARASLHHGDVVRIGKTELAFHDPASAAEEIEPAPAPIEKAPKKPAVDLGRPPPKKFKIDAPPPKKVNIRLKPGKSRRDRLR